MSEGNGYASRDAFLAGFKRRYKDATVPFLGKVLIGNQSEKERQDFELWLKDKRGDVRGDRRKIIRVKYIVDCVYTGTLEQPGPRMFSNGDIQTLVDADLDFASTNKLVSNILDHMGLGDDVEELAKN